jgi:DnaJ like chaperone protein
MVVVERWLRRKMIMEAGLSVMLALLSLAGSILVLGLLLGFVIMIGLMAGFFLVPGSAHTNEALHSSLRMALLFGVGFIGLVFLGNAFSRGERAVDVRFRIKRNQHGEKVFSTYVTSPTKDMEDLLYIGPRLFNATFGHIRNAHLQMNLDTVSCAKLLCVLLSRNSRFSFQELNVKAGLRHSLELLPQLHFVEGVVFLPSHPAGLSLTDDLRKELFGLFRRSYRTVKEEPVEETQDSEEAGADQTSPKAPGPDSPYIVLGLTEKATLEQIKSAYRKKIKECHPDKFTRLGDEWRKMAEERAKLLNIAYETIMAERSGIN